MIQVSGDDRGWAQLWEKTKWKHVYCWLTVTSFIKERFNFFNCQYKDLDFLYMFHKGAFHIIIIASFFFFSFHWRGTDQSFHVSIWFSSVSHLISCMWKVLAFLMNHTIPFQEFILSTQPLPSNPIIKQK